MIAPARELLRRRLSDQTFQNIRSGWWHASFYVPHLLASKFVRRKPKVRTFPDNRRSGLGERIRRINLYAPTPMCRVMTRLGSDKGQGWHNYTAVYAVLFANLLDRPLRIFELGLGTNNPQYAFNMGPNGRPGASLRGWREIFPAAQVFGADIDRTILFEEERIQTFYCDQLDSDVIRDLWAQPALQGGMDVIIDDGLHTFEGNTTFLEASLDQIRPGGFFIIEDMYRDALPEWFEPLNKIYTRRWPTFEFALVELPNPLNDQENNNIMIIHRPL